MHLYICASVSISLWLNRSSIYLFISTPSGVELVCGFDLPETRTMCTSVDQAVHICKLDWMLGRKPESNYSRDDIRSIQIPRAFQPPVRVCTPFRLFGFGCHCKLARTYNYIPSLLPLPDSQGSTQLCPGTDFWLCRQIFRTWLNFPTSL